MFSGLSTSSASVLHSLPPIIKPDNSGDKNAPYAAGLQPPTSRATPGGAGLTVADLAALKPWELAVICLPSFDWWDDDTLTLYDIMDAVGARTYDGLQRVAQKTWPNWDGRYKLQFPHICRLVRNHLKDAKVKHSPDELLRRARTVLEARQ